MRTREDRLNALFLTLKTVTIADAAEPGAVLVAVKRNDLTPSAAQGIGLMVGLKCTNSTRAPIGAFVGNRVITAADGPVLIHRYIWEG
jgi:hypothetical protein